VPEQWESTTAGRHLSGRRATDTAPELALRLALHASGNRFRLHQTLAAGCTPDIVLRRRRIVVFVDGCFWHGCPEHGRVTPWTGPNAELWAAKMARNRRRDERASALARSLGWHVVRIWEHEIMADPNAAARTVLAIRPEGDE